MKQVLVPRKNLVFGTLFILVGISLLLYTSGLLPHVLDFWPLVLVVTGLYLLYRAYVIGGPESFVMYGIFIVLAGAFLLLLNMDPFSDIHYRSVWPFFVLFAGIALLMYARKRKGESRIRYKVPGISLVALSVVFMLFSSGWIGISLKKALVQFWSLLLVLCGVYLLVFDYIRNKKKTKAPKNG